MSLQHRARNTRPRLHKGAAGLNVRAIAITVLVVVSSASFTLGFFVGKSTTGPKTVSEASPTTVTPPAAERQPEETLKPVIEVPPRPDPEAMRGDHPAPPGPAEAEGTANSFSVQVGAYSESADAEKIRDEFRQKGYNAYIVRSAEGDQKTIYRVRIGDFPSKADARRMVLELKRREDANAYVTEGR